MDHGCWRLPWCRGERWVGGGALFLGKGFGGFVVWKSFGGFWWWFGRVLICFGGLEGFWWFLWWLFNRILIYSDS